MNYGAFLPKALMFAGLAALLLTSLVSAPVYAQATHSLREAMFGNPPQDGRRHNVPDIAYFSTEDGLGFVFDNSQKAPAVRYNGSDEVWALTATRGPKGDVMFKNDVGEPVLRATRWGGFTLFRPERPSGDPVSLVGKGKAIMPGVVSPDLLFRYLVGASRKATFAARRLIPFGAPEVSQGSDYLFADAAKNTAEAMMELSKQNNGPKLLEPVREVRLIEGHPPEVRLEDGVLELKLDPQLQWGGRPSSRRVMTVIRSASAKN
jgi:hypothetical protein